MESALQESSPPSSDLFTAWELDNLTAEQLADPAINQKARASLVALSKAKQEQTSSVYQDVREEDRLSPELRKELDESLAADKVVDETLTDNVVTESVIDQTFASEGGLDDVNLKINIGQQNKHIPGTNNYKQELANGKLKSILSADPQQLLDDFAGTGQKIGTNKERVDFGDVIGKYVNPETGESVDTTVGIIHYGKNGAHIVPARPK